MPASRSTTTARGAGRRTAAQKTDRLPTIRPRTRPTPRASMPAQLTATHLPMDVRRDLAALGTILLALVSAAALVTPDPPAPLRLLRDAQLLLTGRGAPLMLAWLLLLGLAMVPGLDRLRPDRVRATAALVGTLALLGLLHLSRADGAAAAAAGEGGGHVGYTLARLLVESGGLLVAGLLLGTALVASLITFSRLSLTHLLAALSTLGRLLLAVVALTFPPAGARPDRAAAAPPAAAPARAPFRWPWSSRPRLSLAEEYALAVRRGDFGLVMASGAATPNASPTPSVTGGPPPAPSPAQATAPPGPQLILPTPTTAAAAPPAKPAKPTAAPRPVVVSALWKPPPLTLLDSYPSSAADPGDAQAKAKVIDQTLASFRVEARVREIYAGPSFTQFAVEPGEGVKVRRITELHNDLALALAVPSLRIEAPVPGKARVGIEIPNVSTATVGLRDTLESEEFTGARLRLKLPVVLGRDVSGRPVVVDMARMPHLLIAGATGSGKSVCLNAVIICLLLQFAPDVLRLVMIDPKRVELSSYNGIPHLQAPVVTEMDKVVGLLRKSVQEMERRYELLMRLGVRNLDGYLKRCEDDPHLERLPYLVIIVDELADLMMTAPDEVEGLVCRLAQMGRATGIHLILATQRPSVDVVTGLIKANFPSRIAFAVSSQIDSRVILDSPGAERLMGRGDMLYQAGDAPKPQRIQGVYLSDGNIEKIVGHWRHQAEAPTFDPEWLNVPSHSPAESNDGDELFDQATTLVREQGTVSASMLQRRLRIGYNRAARLIEAMEAKGIIGPSEGRLRPVLAETGETPAVAPPPAPAQPPPPPPHGGKADAELPL